MKALLYIILLVLVVACKPSKGKIDPRVLTLPAFNMQLLDSTRMLNTGNITAGQPTILVYFNPDCKFSRQQTETIIRNYRPLQHIRFFMFSPYPLQKLHDFYTHYQLNRFANITMGRDHDLFFDKELKVPSFPWLFIYSSDKKLKRIITGNADVQTILKNING